VLQDVGNPQCRLLVTSALECTWGVDEPVLFLGEWCRLYDRRAVWGARQHETVPHHWFDRSKLRRDYRVLCELHATLVGALAVDLNALHGVQRPTTYWRQVLDPWLASYVAVVFDRWECLRLAFADGSSYQTIVLSEDARSPPPNDYDAHLERAIGDVWNHRLFAAMILQAYPERCAVRYTTDRPEAGTSVSRAPPRASLLARAAAFADHLGGLLGGGEQVVLFETYFSPRALARLSLALRQIPRLYRREFAWTPAGAATELSRERRLLLKNFEPKDRFQAFLRIRLRDDMPRALVEDYPLLAARAARIRITPSTIATANAHWHNDLFKVWSAEAVLQGARLIIMDHGGCVPMAFNMMEFEDGIASTRACWAIPRDPRDVQVPPNKLVGRRVRTSGRFCAVLGHEEPRYVYCAGAFPMNEMVLVGFEMVCKFHSQLHAAPRSGFRVRPYPKGGWNTRQRYIDRLGPDAVDVASDYDDFVAAARIIVCTYPQTTLAEAIASGQPTILMYPSELWETAPQFASMLESMRGARMLFDDALAAAAHINDIWAAPRVWWNSSAVRAVRQEFQRQFVPVRNDWLRPWVDLLKARAA